MIFLLCKNVCYIDVVIVEMSCNLMNRVIKITAVFFIILKVIILKTIKSSGDNNAKNL